MADTLMTDYIAAKTNSTFEAFLNNKMKEETKTAQKPLDDMAAAVLVTVQKLYPKVTVKADYSQNTITISPEAKEMIKPQSIVEEL